MARLELPSPSRIQAYQTSSFLLSPSPQHPLDTLLFFLPQGESFSCDDERGDHFITNWRQNPVKGLCEDSAESKINCYDAAGGRARFCLFENAMFSLKKMRKKIRADGSPSRSWEQGFLAASCGEKGQANIGYFPLYKPDIDGSSDAVCDYVFNETVLAYR